MKATEAVKTFTLVPRLGEVVVSHSVLVQAMSSIKVKKRYIDNRKEGLRDLLCSRYDRGIKTRETTTPIALDANESEL